MTGQFGSGSPPPCLPRSWSSRQESASCSSFKRPGLRYRAIAENLERERELFVAGGDDYRNADPQKRLGLLVDRVELFLADQTAQFLASQRTTRESPDTAGAEKKVVRNAFYYLSNLHLVRLQSFAFRRANVVWYRMNFRSAGFSGVICLMVLGWATNPYASRATVAIQRIFRDQDNRHAVACAKRTSTAIGARESHWLYW
jgi:hypothetical protein